MLEKSEIEKLYNAFVEEIPVFLAFSESKRLKIFLRIMQHGSAGASVNEIAAVSKLSRPAVSHHVKVLKDYGLIASEKSGTKIYYRISCEDKFLRLKKNLAILETGFANMDLESIQENSGKLAEMIEDANQNQINK